ncbi:hypothetical protein [Bradyrhizobium sp. JR3.5]
MGIFNTQGNLVPIHADNAKTRDWLILLEAATIVGHQRERLRVALTTQQRKLVKRRRLLGKTEYYLVIDGYDPRIHALYFCPQLYRNEGGTLVPLTGAEIGQLMAQALEGGAVEKSPWYEPADGLPNEPIIKATPEMEFDSLVIDNAVAQTKPTLRPVSLAERERE